MLLLVCWVVDWLDGVVGSLMLEVGVGELRLWPECRLVTLQLWPECRLVVLDSWLYVRSLLDVARRSPGLRSGFAHAIDHDDRDQHGRAPASSYHDDQRRV